MSKLTKEEKDKLKKGLKGKEDTEEVKEPEDEKVISSDKEDESEKEKEKEDEDVKENAGFDFLSNFVDAVINDVDADAELNISEFIKLKAKEKVAAITERRTTPEENDDEEEEEETDYTHLLANRDKKKAPLKKMKDVKEAALIKVLKEFMDDDSPIRLKGDDVFVNNKLVGTLENDLSNADAGIVFRSADGKGGKDFNNIQELYQFLVKKFEVSPESALGGKDGK